MGPSNRFGHAAAKHPKKLVSCGTYPIKIAQAGTGGGGGGADVTNLCGRGRPASREFEVVG